MISQSALSTVRETLPVVGAAIGDITPIFYKRMFTARPDLLRDLFNRGNQAQGEQQKALAGAIAAYASLLVSDDAPNIDAMMSRIANKHASLGITEDQYPIVYEHLFAAIGEVLGDAATPEVVDAWTEVYWDMADALIKAEKELYARHDVAPGDVVARPRRHPPPAGVAEHRQPRPLPPRRRCAAAGPAGAVRLRPGPAARWCEPDPPVQPDQGHWPDQLDGDHQGRARSRRGGHPRR